MIGVDPEELNPGHFVDVVHPDDVGRLGLSEGSDIYTLEKEVLETQKGSALTSFTLRMRNPSGVYFNLFVQDYMFSQSDPSEDSLSDTGYH